MNYVPAKNLTFYYLGKKKKRTAKNKKQTNKTGLSPQSDWMLRTILRLVEDRSENRGEGKQESRVKSVHLPWDQCKYFADKDCTLVNR